MEQNFIGLTNHLRDVIWEQQLKLGYLEEKVRLYYPLSTLNHLLHSHHSTNEMQTTLETAVQQTPEPWSQLTVTHQEERFCLQLSAKLVGWLHLQLQQDAFWPRFIGLMKQPAVTMEQVQALFAEYADTVICQTVTHGEFDVLLYFANGQPDAYYYCFQQEGCSLTYHRFLKEDYEELGLAS